MTEPCSWKNISILWIGTTGKVRDPNKVSRIEHPAARRALGKEARLKRIGIIQCRRWNSEPCLAVVTKLFQPALGGLPVDVLEECGDIIRPF